MKSVGLLDHVDLTYGKVGYQERKIIEVLAEVFLITFVKVSLFKSESYCYAFLKPSPELKEKYRLQNEILVIINRHNDFDARSFDYVDKLLFEFQNRLDKLCVLFVSQDRKVKEKIKNHTQQNPESRIIIPFSYYDFIANGSSELINIRLKEFFYGRDLFSFESALQNDTYFYGRTETVQFFYDKYKSGENCGLFGLRKIGKTSVLFALGRYLILRNEIPVFIDCQEPAFHKRRWFECLQFIIQTLVESVQAILDRNIDFKLNENYTEKDASIYFQDDLLKVYKVIQNKRILIIFDEIENITFEISPTEHWRSGEEFIYFWQSIRAVFQKHPYLFSYLIAGVNPKAIETPTVNSFDNPIYRMITPTYLKFFENKNVKDMVSAIGNYMGLDFEEEIYTYLTEDFGGHPFLIRQVCSKIHQEVTNNRPTKVSKYFYQEKKEQFNLHLNDYIELIIEVLRRWYPKEYNLIELLAIDDYENFEKQVFQNEKITEHLLGYNIIEKSDSKFYIRIIAVKNYIIQNTKVTKSLDKIEDKWKLITEKRNKLELELRKLVKMTLKLNHGPIRGKDEFLKIIGTTEKRKDTLNSMSIDDLFSGHAELYFDDLRRYIEKNWVEFEKVFSDKQLFGIYMPIVNKYRIDAHAKDIDDQTLNILILALEWIKSKVDTFLA
ncbi:ATP-binding protein [Inquilinus sp. KBS0705]|nr:ATP-binding protein [Inquilinus sp. KBS0705]